MTKMKFKVVDELEDVLDSDNFNSKYQKPVKKEQEDYAIALFNCLQELVDENENGNIDEAFLARSELVKHFKKHCLGTSTTKKSGRNNVYYDFKYVNEYRDYENEILNKLHYTKYIVGSLLDKDMNRYMRRLFEGGCTILFTTSCGLNNNSGSYCLGVHAFSSYVTTNYGKQNTIDLLIADPTLRNTISIFAVDANYFENKLNSMIRNQSNANVTLKFNH